MSSFSNFHRFGGTRTPENTATKIEMIDIAVPMRTRGFFRDEVKGKLDLCPRSSCRFLFYLQILLRGHLPHQCPAD